MHVMDSSLILMARLFYGGVHYCVNEEVQRKFEVVITIRSECEKNSHQSVEVYFSLLNCNQ